MSRTRFRLPNSNLINGLGRYIGGNSTELAVIKVEKGKRYICILGTARYRVSYFYGHRYRFRLLNMGCDPNYVFQIDGHNFTVIEADGVSHQAVNADAIQIFTGMYCLLSTCINVIYIILQVSGTPS